MASYVSVPRPLARSQTPQRNWKIHCPLGRQTVLQFRGLRTSPIFKLHKNLNGQTRLNKKIARGTNDY